MDVCLKNCLRFSLSNVFHQPCNSSYGGGLGEVRYGDDEKPSVTIESIVRLSSPLWLQE